VVATLPATVKGEPLLCIGGITDGPDRARYYAEDSAIRRIDAQGDVSTVVAVSARVDGPSIPGMDERPYLRGLAVNDRGVAYVADAGDARVLKVTPDASVSP